MFQNLGKYTIAILIVSIVFSVVAFIVLSSTSYSYFAMNSNPKSKTSVKLYFDNLDAEYPLFINNLTINDNNSLESGIYKINDEYTSKTGLESIYYRGYVDNNWFYFENMYWRIVRINGNGDIKLIYYGDNEPTELDSITRTDNSIYATAVNIYNNITMIDDVQEISYKDNCEADSINYKESNLETFLNEWYEERLIDAIGIVPNSIYYNDRMYEANDELNGYYAGYSRIINNKPSLLNPNYRDSYTSDKLYGNGELTHPIGVLTADEYLLAGEGYLNENHSSWTMTPANIENGCSSMFVYRNALDIQKTNEYAGVRPVIIIDGNLEIVGQGLYNDPYRYN